NRAMRAGIPVKVVYGVSIVCAAAGSLGLMHYKFGRTVTIPYPEEGYLPTSPYEHLRENMERGLHTLLLLDIRAEEGRYMTPKEALEILLAMQGASEREMEKGVLGPDTTVCVCSRVGGVEERVAAGHLSFMLGYEAGPPPRCLVIPGKLHFVEEESLALIWKGGGGP
ncbi:MAG: diphthine synthase, partial [Thermoplasmata archaeon]|nr:diphthine synthase [Thermoplasmata archaeon]